MSIADCRLEIAECRLRKFMYELSVPTCVNLKSTISNLKSKISNLKSKICNLKSSKGMLYNQQITAVFQPAKC